MSTLDEITKEKQRISEALDRLNAQREKLAGQISELEATERVLARYSGMPAKRTTSRNRATKATEAAAQAQSGRRRRRTATGKSARPDDGSPSLGDRILALATGKTQLEIAACKGVRPNHIGIAVARHKRAGRIEERDGKLYATHSTAT
jgi:hypothetical protein